MNRGRGLGQLAMILGGRLPVSPDWISIIGLANEQLITPELCDHLRRANLFASLPVDLRPFLEDVESRTRTRLTHLSDTLADALSALNAAGIEPILLKGCALWAITPRSRTRLISDIDLLVRPVEIDAAVGALTRKGFSISKDQRGEAFHQSVELSRRSDVGSIDLHQHMPGPASLARGIDAYAHCARVEMREGVALAPSAELQIFTTVLHDQFQDGRFWRGGFDLRHLLDIATLAGLGAGVDWQRVLDLCPTPMVRLAMVTQLCAAKSIAGAAIPAWLANDMLGKIHARRQRAQYVWPVLNAPLHGLGLNKTVWMRLSTRMWSRSPHSKDRTA